VNKEIICTVCPRGCHVNVEYNNGKIERTEGYSCKRGMEFAVAETLHPVRILTTTVKIANIKGELLPVRSAAPIPREKLMECMTEIRKAEVKTPIARYDVIIPDICGTGIDIVAVKNVD